MKRTPKGTTCIVCNRPGATARTVEGVTVVICDDCEGDRYMRAEAVRRASEK